MQKKRRRFHGFPVSPGIAAGHVCLIGLHQKADKTHIKHKNIQSELDNLKDILSQTRKEIEDIRSKVDSKLGRHEAEIFDLQILMTKDPYFWGQIEHKVAVELKNIAWAIEETMEESMRLLQQTDDPYLRERYQDLQDVGTRILNNLFDTQAECILDENDDIIIAAENLVPSQTVHLRTDRIRGFITEKGGATGHAAILARSLGVPLVSGLINLTDVIYTGAKAIVDGYRGDVFINPPEDRIKRYRYIIETIRRRDKEAEKLALLPSVTKDKTHIHLLANISTRDDIENAKKVGSEGVGLYRTELHFMSKDEFADEESQYQDYRAIAEKNYPNPVTIRTLDLGGDKFLNGTPTTRDPNPYLGLRAIRISLQHPDIFKVQLRAIFRAAVLGNIKLLLPMISSIEEVLEVKKLMRSVINDLEKEHIEYNPNLPVGVMVEIPSTAINIHSFLKEVDFVSVGTNDLIQYTLAVDRGNEKVSAFYQPFHPSILTLLEKVGKTAQKMGKEASVCGEIAGDPLYTELLLGFGYRHLSMSTPFILGVKMRVKNINIKEAEKVAAQALKFSKCSDIRNFVERQIHKSV